MELAFHSVGLSSHQPPLGEHRPCLAAIGTIARWKAPAGALLLLLGLAWPGLPAAQPATVVRDGSLVFLQADRNSTVLGILPRGAHLTILAQEGAGWYRVQLPGEARSGYMSAESLGPGTAEDRPSAATASGGGLQNELDQAQAKLRRAERMLSRMEEMLDVIEERGVRPRPAPQQESSAGAAGRTDRKPTAVAAQPMTDGEAKFDGGLGLGGGAFWGYALDERAPTFGGTLLWRPGFLGGLGIEFTNDWTFLEERVGLVRSGLGLFLGLPWRPLGLEPYLAGGGGMVWLWNGGPDGPAEWADPAAEAGGGAFLPLNRWAGLQADLRSLTRFTGGGQSSHDLRLRLGLHYRWGGD